MPYSGPLTVWCTTAMRPLASRPSPTEPYIRRPSSFFFSSRRRHTRLQGDWSSDVCSSDLPRQIVFVGRIGLEGHIDGWYVQPLLPTPRAYGGAVVRDERAVAFGGVARSEERRVGKEGRSRWSPYH